MRQTWFYNNLQMLYTRLNWIYKYRVTIIFKLNKLFEDYIYAYIKYAILNSKVGVQEYVVRRSQKDKSSLLRNAKIRLSNIHPGRLIMAMRGQNKWLK